MNFFMHPDMAVQTEAHRNVHKSGSTTRAGSIDPMAPRPPYGQAYAVPLGTQEPDRAGRANQEEGNRYPETREG